MFLSRLQQYLGSALGMSEMFAIGPLARVFLQSRLLQAKLRQPQKNAQRCRHHHGNNNKQHQQ
jgi:hypothetical protein